ncbi:MAG: ATP-binding protein [Erysipelothrix sp.]|nr:ATP-binding protein [Erysipelothrix sp.]
MSLRDFSYNLDKDALEKRKHLIEALRNHVHIIKFMEKYDCPFSVVENNALKFEKWLHDIERISKISKEQLKSNPTLGGYVDLHYDSSSGLLLEEYTFLDVSKDAIDAQKHFGNYQVFPLNDSLKKADFKDIHITNTDTKSYLLAFKEAISFSKDEALGLYIYGDLGVGKSYLAACITNKFAKEGKSVAFVSPSDLLSHLKGNFGSFTTDTSLERLKHVHVLVIDDIGAEPISAWGRDEVLLPLLNARLENFRKTIFTSNYTPEMLENVYALDTRGNLDRIRSKRFVDRILAIGRPIEISGENRRRK